MPLNDRSRIRLMGVHADLVKVIERAYELSTNPFIVTEGLRTLERQKQLVAKGASQTLDSRHLTGHAADLAVMVDGEVRWDWPLYRKLGDTVKAAAKELSVPIVWGGDWKGFPDGPHFELNRKTYPAG
jgi:peptidoglycan L-alanyl-D-glutamate endopeptidase CwlK